MMNLKSVIAILALILSGLTVSAQSVPQIVLDLKESFNEAQNVEARFEITISEPEQEERQSIGVYSHNGKLFKLESDFQRVYFDGTDVYVYDEQINEVQINTYDEEDESLLQLSPINLIATLEADDFIFQTLPNGQIELRPNDNTEDYKKIRLTTLENELTRAELFLDGNIKIDISMLSLDLKADHQDTDFSIPKPLLKSANVEDLRF